MSNKVYNKIDIDYGIQIVFSTIPNKGSHDFVEGIDKNYYQSYKDKIKSKDDYLFTPLKFYMLGDYDVCYVSLINNFNFSHRLFESIDDKNDTYHNTHTFQSYSGFALNKKEYLENFFFDRRKRLETEKKEYFIGVINLKLNNGLLIGNGIHFIEAVYKYIENNIIKEVDKDIPFVVSQTFSWFELSLVILIDNPNKLTEVLARLRSSEFDDLLKCEYVIQLGLNNIFESSLYHSILDKNIHHKINHTSLFADIHSYFGFNEKLITEDKESQYNIDFQKHIDENNISLHTVVEWHVKPGHIQKLEKILENNKELEQYSSFPDKKFLLGKSDYILLEKHDNILCNYNLLRYVYRDESLELYKHIRKVRSYVYLDAKNINKYINYNDEYLSWEGNLEKFAFTPTDFYRINVKLKALKISRQVRVKILKLFSNYNHGIQDPILFPYFVDFTVFIENLVKLIDTEYAEIDTISKPIMVLEKILLRHIEVFQEGYNVRFLNSYQFENISDFDLDFNSSIQQLLSSYGTLVYEMGKLFYESDQEVSPIIKLNNVDTESNYLSVNYSIYHLTSPEFVYTTLLKEFLNNLKLDRKEMDDVLQDFDNKLRTIKDKINESYLDDMFNSKLIKMDYFIIDSIRLIITFNNDFVLFQHWFWTYNFQNSSLFDSSGMFNEDVLRQEMFRLMLIYYMFEFDSNSGIKIECPTPELYTHWHRHHFKIKKLAKKLIDEIDNISFAKVIKNITDIYLSSYESLESFPDSFDVQAIKKYTDNNSKLYNADTFAKKICYLLNHIEGVNNKTHKMEKIIFHTLKNHFEINESIVTLKRNWKNGNVMTTHNELYKESLYAIDQTGGVYFYDLDKINEYFKLNAKSLLEIIDFSLKSKKDFMLKRIDS